MDESRAHIKRGGFARDTRTNAIVKVTEKGGRDWMVKPAYKTDGYWVGPEHLRAAQDPHIWTGSSFVKAFVCLAASLFSVWGPWRDFRSHGFGAVDSTVYAVPLFLVAWVVTSTIAGIRRH